MTIKEFERVVEEKIKERMGEDVRTEIRTVVKNNDKHYEALVIKTTDSNISPTIYLESYFEKYQNGLEMEKVIDNIMEVYEYYKVDGHVDMDFYYDFESVRKKLAFKLVNVEKNREYLKEVPHIEFLDLAVVFYYIVDSLSSGSASIVIRNEHMKMWNVTANDLFREALKTTPEILPPDPIDLEPVAEAISNEEIAVSIKNLPMIVMTNICRVQGSAVILYPGFLEAFAKCFEEDYYIVPSSVHEVILIPRRLSIGLEEMNSLIARVNATNLEAEDVLSDHVYLYSVEKQELMIP